MLKIVTSACANSWNHHRCSNKLKIQNKMVYPIFSFGWNGHRVQSNQHLYIRIRENDLELLSNILHRLITIFLFPNIGKSIK